MGMNGGDVIDLVCLLEGTRLPLEGARKLAELFSQNGKPARTQSAGAGENSPQTHLSKGQANPTTVVEKNKPLAFTLKDVNPCHELIQSRGISPETAKEFGVGYFPGKGSMAGRIVFPLYEEGSVVGYCGRATNGQEPKWLMPKGLVKSFLYGLERCDPAKLLILTEGFWAPLFFFQRGAQAASLMGKSLTEAQEKCLEPFATICVAMDNDIPGHEAAEKICARLKGTHKVMKASLMEG
jgi:DNA primase